MRGFFSGTDLLKYHIVFDKFIPFSHHVCLQTHAISQLKYFIHLSFIPIINLDKSYSFWQSPLDQIRSKVTSYSKNENADN